MNEGQEQQLKQLHNKMLEIYAKFREVTQSLNLRYWAIGGTAIGAVRHKGFIPWDDDMDFYMPFQDMLKLKNNEKKLSPYEIHDDINDCLTVPSLFKIHDPLTTFLDGRVQTILGKSKNGVFIDALPIIPLPCNRNEKRKYLLKLKFFTLLIGLKKRTIRPIHTMIKKQYKPLAIVLKIPFVLIPYNILIKYYIKLLAQYDYYDDGVEEVFLLDTYLEHLFANKKNAAIILPKSYFGDGTKLPFEKTDIILPAEFDKFLRRQFNGNYMLPPPEKEQIPKHLFGPHATAVLDLNTPCAHYLGKEEK